MITIKESTHDDIRNIQNLWADEDVMRYIWPGGLHETEEGVREYLDRIIDTRPKSNHYSIFDDGKYCGETQYRIDENTQSAALDIKLFKFAQGRGIATQTLSYSIQEAFKNGASSVSMFLISALYIRKLIMRKIQVFCSLQIGIYRYFDSLRNSK